MSSNVIDLSADSPPPDNLYGNDISYSNSNGNNDSAYSYSNDDGKGIWQPFFLNRLGDESCLSSSARRNNTTSCLTIQDIISNENKIGSVVILTFEIDPQWFLESLPYIIDLPLLVLHGGKNQKDVQLPNMEFSPVGMG
jgi:hypothetical protein